ncbi:MAG: PD-(D/E)XK nuclease family protein, partial [Aestuariivirga sp.]
QSSLKGITEIAAPDRHAEARTIAVILRQTLEKPDRTAILVTPNRDLSKRVISELARWNIAIADSAGTSLAQFRLGAALDLLLQAVFDGFAPEATFALLHHPDVQSNFPRDILAKFEYAVLRGLTLTGSTFESLASQARAMHAADTHAHPLVKALTEEDWQAMAQLAQTLDALAKTFEGAQPAPLTEQVKLFETCLRKIATAEIWEDAINAPFLDFLDELISEVKINPSLSVADAALLVRDLLRTEVSRADAHHHPRLSILGTLEARLMPADLIILGGLNEGTWPSVPDAGPWLNSKMRSELGLPQPERSIGMEAHDFEQGLAQPEVIVTWSKRLNHAPAGPSRWLLRLANVRAAAGIIPDGRKSDEWLALAAQLKTPNGSESFSVPISKPNFAPPLIARPRRFSATEVEKLIRNPYAIYARKVLALEPLPEFGFDPDASDRGTLFHKALQNWNMQSDRSEAALLAAGEKAFATLSGNAEARNFWWPHFRRVVPWLAERETEFADGLLSIKAESSGRHTFQIEGDD